MSTTAQGLHCALLNLDGVCVQEDLVEAVKLCHQDFAH